ncbi:hypothetical protein B0H14DRAFT_2751120, partial [Mycena olivaceomarginata]
MPSRHTCWPVAGREEAGCQYKHERGFRRDSQCGTGTRCFETDTAQLTTADERRWVFGSPPTIDVLRFTFGRCGIPTSDLPGDMLFVIPSRPCFRANLICSFLFRIDLRIIDSPFVSLLSCRPLTLSRALLFGSSPPYRSFLASFAVFLSKLGSHPFVLFLLMLLPSLPSPSANFNKHHP